MRNGRLFSIALLLLLLIGPLLVIWLTVPGHAAGQIIITTQDVGHPVITVQENAIAQQRMGCNETNSLWTAKIPAI